jgi:hypothetical protein
VRDRVAELWVKDKADELALERVKTMRETFASEPPSGEKSHEEVEGEEHDHRYTPADAFRSAAETAGATVATRGWVDRGAEVVPTDPALDAETNTFLRNQRQLAGLDDDEVTGPLVDNASKRVYLVRLAGRRPVPIDRLSPDDLENRYEPRAALERRRALLAEPSIEYLEKHFGLYFVRPEGEEEPAEETPAG